jgi:putative endonuclease
MALHNELGQKGEAIAVEFLISKGHQILATNYRYKHAEIDIISRIDNTLVFTEVKARSTDKFGFPEEAVSEKKQEKLMEAAQQYLEENELKITYQFDVIAIVFEKGFPKIHHIPDAF